MSRRNTGNVGVGAALLAALMIVLTSCSDPGPQEPPDSTPVRDGAQQTFPRGEGTLPGSSTTVEALRARLYRVGDCVVYEPDNSAGSGGFPGIHDLTVTRVVPCDQPHFYEITGIYEVPGRSNYPTDEEWAAIFRGEGEGCKALAERYMNGPVDPYGRFRLSGIKPTRDYWTKGSRRVSCALTGVAEQGANPGGGPVLTSGSARGQSQSRLRAKGTCLALNVDTQQVTGSVTCDKPHGFEVSGSFSIADRTATRPTSQEDWRSVLGTDCRALAEQYLGRPIDMRTVRSSYFEIRQESWDAGRREVECLVARYGTDGNPVLVEGPLGGHLD